MNGLNRVPFVPGIFYMKKAGDKVKLVYIRKLSARKRPPRWLTIRLNPPNTLPAHGLT